MTPDNHPQKSTASFAFSGEREIYDDGVFRIEFPAELIPEADDDREDSVIFTINELPVRIEWSTLLADNTQLQQIGAPTDDIESVMRFFIPDLSEGETLRITPLANGFNIASHTYTRDGEYTARCLLAQYVNEDTIAANSIELTAPQEMINDPCLVFLQHILKGSVRHATCSLGEPRMNSSRAFLNIGKIGVRFPDELGGMSSLGEPRMNSSRAFLNIGKIGVRFPDELGGMKFRFATDYEHTGAGEGVSLRYSDEQGRKADIYFYDDREEFIEPGAETDQNLAQMESAMLQLETACEPSISELLSESVSCYGREALAFLDRRFLITGAEPEDRGLVTVILLAARLGAFIKVRFTPLPGETHPKHPLLETFMNDLADVLAA